MPDCSRSEDMISGNRDIGCHWTTKVTFLWILVFSISLLLGLVIFMVVFGSKEYSLSSRDMIFANEKLSSFFCAGVGIEPKSQNVHINQIVYTAYLVGHTPNIDTSRREIYNESSTFLTKYNENFVREFYFLRGSKLRLSICTDGSVVLYVFQGRANYTKFINEYFICEECYMTSIKYSNTCGKYLYYRLSVPVSDFYYFVFHGVFLDSLTMTKFMIDRTVYSTKNVLNKCQNETRCYFLFNDLLQTYGVVIQRSESTDKSLVNFETKCVMRVWVYILIFIVIPLLICLVGSFLIYKYKSNRTEHHLIQTHIQNTSTGSYGSVTSSRALRLPRYEEIANLPSYQEAVGSNPFDEN